MQDFKLIWKIENINFLPPQRGKALKSPPFKVNLLGSTFLELYPKGDILDPDGEYIIICLNNCIKLPHTSVTCEVHLVTIDSSYQFKTEKIHDCTKWRFKKELPLNQHFIKGDRNDMDFSKSTLTVTCNFSHNTDMAKGNQKPGPADSKDMMLLSRDMEKLFIEQELSDITLVAGTEKFPVHKAVLHARLPKLVADLESANDQRELSDMEPSVLKLLLEYAYSGKISAKSTNIPGGLYDVANDLGISDLKQKIFSYPSEVTARTCVKVDRNVFTWPVKGIQDMELNQRVYSPSFTGSVIPGSDLKLSCYLAYGADHKLYLNISVHRIFPDKNNPIFVRCKITVLDQLTLFQCAEHVFVADEEWHFPSFIHVNRHGRRVMVGKNQLAFPKTPHHGVPLKCEFSISGCELSEIEETVCSSTRFEDFVRQGEDVRCLCTDLGQLYNIFLPKLSDITLMIGDVRFPAHKAVLSARSPVFTKMFSSDMIEAQSGVVKITDIDIAVMNMMLQYIYSAKVDILNQDSAVKLFSAADKYEVTSLKEKCSAYLKEVLCSDNACDLLVLADMHGDIELKDFVKEFISAHADTILESGDWKILMESRLDLATEIVRGLITIVLNHNRECRMCSK
ncbi:hypothetical protein JTE90_019165 [Oedothorax gibbosus]|uniref:BTB domain-containing protein n=1 Tax=Oedothorax gibbosus TaxID=931172 RepID=A0AAV6UVL4_9ARAC|nr:hypothetical protein JTE90_019165 [Oedothorax gibbosus]